MFASTVIMSALLNVSLIACLAIFTSVFPLPTVISHNHHDVMLYMYQTLLVIIIALVYKSEVNSPERRSPDFEISIGDVGYIHE